MTAVPGEPGRRLLLSSSARRAGNGTRPALAWGSVGLRLMTTLRILKRCGGCTQTASLHHRDGAAPVPDRRILPLSSISNRHLANPVPTTGFRTIPTHCGQIAAALGKVADFLRCHDRGRRRVIPSSGRRRYAVCYIRPPVRRHRRNNCVRLADCSSARQASRSETGKDIFGPRADTARRTAAATCDRKDKARPQQPGFTFPLKSRRRYFTPPTLPNWLSNGL